MRILGICRSGNVKSGTDKNGKWSSVRGKEGIGIGLCLVVMPDDSMVCIRPTMGDRWTRGHHLKCTIGLLTLVIPVIGRGRVMSSRERLTIQLPIFPGIRNIR